MPNTLLKGRQIVMPLSLSAGQIGLGQTAQSNVAFAISGTLTGGATTQAVFEANPVFPSSATTRVVVFEGNVTTAAAAFTVPDARVFSAPGPSLGAGSAISNNYGVYVGNQGATGVQNAWGIFVATQSGAAGYNVAIALGSSNERIRNQVNNAASLSVESADGILMLAGKTFAEVACNASYDGAAWQRFDTSAGGMLMQVGNAATQWFMTPSGANPISFTNVMTLDSAGILTVAGRTKWMYDSGWITPTFANGWSSYGSPFQCQYRKMADGTVVVRGLVQGGNVNMGAPYAYFTLPAGYRPASGWQYLFACAGISGVIRIDVDSSGNVFAQETKAGTYANGWQSLDGVRFLAEA